MSTSDVDVVIVGAGLSGIGAAYRIQETCPDKSYLILESREAIGGTWDLFRYPGVRSDSDMYTLSYPFRPWTNAKSIADGDDICTYIRAAADEFAITAHIRFQHRVTDASWSSADAQWTIRSSTPAGPIEITANFVYLCSGYFSYEEGYRPAFAGIDTFQGQIVHPQFWPEDLDYDEKRVVVIGSGATAVTLIPAMAERAGHVTMLQRSPSYITSLPQVDKLADAMRKVLPAGVAHRAVRQKNAAVAVGFYLFCRRFPRAAKKLLLARAKGALPADFDTVHLTPRYQPWDQRLCIVPNGDLFRSLRSGAASIVTDRVKGFTTTGIELESGEHLDADIVVTATGLKVVAMGQIALEVDGRAVDPHDLITYKGLMFSGIPNLAWCIGYTNASWMLRADLSSQYVARFLKHLDAHGYAAGMPSPAAASGTAPILDLSSGYVQRATAKLPQQGSRTPWTVRQNYFLDAWDNRRTNLDEEMVWTTKKQSGVALRH